MPHYPELMATCGSVWRAADGRAVVVVGVATRVDGGAVHGQERAVVYWDTLLGMLAVTSADEFLDGRFVPLGQDGGKAKRGGRRHAK